MNHFSRLVRRTGSIPAILGLVALAPAAFAGQLFTVGPETPVFISFSSQGYLGIGMRDIDSDRAAALKLKDPIGAEIVTVDHDAPAGKVGLKVHDVIQQMNGQTVQGVEQLRRMIRETPPGRSVALTIVRDGQPQTITVQLADHATLEDAWSNHIPVPDPDSTADGEEHFDLIGPSSHGIGGSSGFLGSFTIGTSSLGVVLDTLGSQLADYFGVKDGQGLLVKHVAENSPASSAGLKAGDVITRVNGEKIATLNTWMKALRNNRGKQLEVTIVRNHKEQIVNVQDGDARHKGVLALPGLPGADIEVVQPPVDAGLLAQLSSEPIQLDPQQLSELSREMKSFDSSQWQKQWQEQLQQWQQQQKQIQELNRKLRLLPAFKLQEEMD